MQNLNSTNIQSWLVWFLRGILILTFLILFARLADLQIIKGEYFKNLAEGNRIREVPIKAPRGKILARGGETLVGSRDIKKRVIFDPQEGYDKTTDIKDVTEEELITEPIREYILGADLAHVTGYLNEAGEKEVGKINGECPEKGVRPLGSLIGRTGLEEEYNCRLFGIDGEELVEVDSNGKMIRILGRKEPVPGEDIKTTIDIALQKKVARLMKKPLDEIEDESRKEYLPDTIKGAVVVSDAKGQILALYSSPSYDPNAFVQKDSQKIAEFLEDKDLPLFNRAIGGLFHPGSVYKPIVSIGALEDKTIDSDFIYEDTGSLQVNTSWGNFSYNNWYFTQYGGVEGEIDLARAIARSTDTFFYKIGEMMGVDKLVSWSKKFEMDQSSNIDLPGEVKGLVPSPEWKERTKDERWFLGNTYHMAIGQGDLALTPMIVHRSIMAIASNGLLCDPYLVEEGKCKSMEISKKSIDYVKEGMQEACSEGGTAYTFFDFQEDKNEESVVACKTGTAETNDSTDTTHAWFVAFSPVKEPNVVITILAEKAGEGSRVGGPVAREIMDYWYERNGD